MRAPGKAAGALMGTKRRPTRRRIMKATATILAAGLTGAFALAALDVPAEARERSGAREVRPGEEDRGTPAGRAAADLPERGGGLCACGRLLRRSTAGAEALWRPRAGAVRALDHRCRTGARRKSQPRGAVRPARPA